MKIELSKEKYLQIQMAIIAIGRTANALDLESFIAQINSAETVAPMVDPTLYRKAAENMHAIKELAVALVPVKRAFEKMFQAVTQTMARGDMEMPPEPPPKQGA